MMDPVPSAGVALDQTLPVVSEEVALLRELQAGSEEAFAYLLGFYQRPVFNLISHILADTGEAADVLQDVFLKVFRGIKHFRGDSSLRTWIYRIAVHESLNHRRGWLRRRLHEAWSIDEEGAAEPPDAETRADTPYLAMEREERYARVTQALGKLPQPYRTVVVLRDIGELPYEEIARVLGVAQGTVKSRLTRGRQMLRRKLSHG